MGHLAGLKDYLDTGYKRSVFDQACASHTLWTLHALATFDEMWLVAALCCSIEAATDDV